MFIASTNEEMNQKKAKKIIEDIVREVEVGQIYLGKVKRIEKFGAFVELFSGKRWSCSYFRIGRGARS
ncbi:hypothetical protein GCM10020331_048560 [Ectobacillus funiculus]